MMQSHAGPVELDLMDAPPAQARRPWGVILAKPDQGSGAEARLEARVTMYPDRSRFFVAYPNGREDILSPVQFVALVLELKRSGRFLFDRKQR
ncbi:hypothetical protein [Phreatobacter stygius]|uniref:Uncharacterized protein n=1 Tax=Phreatobacter stygius TaxID=1940610 RepID=A0A4D7AZ95_9HYPH|nr:hypothetical protein [Phreatobacter stygius]QCI66669.1 hypothetical protein E8M01_21990 [Phreatobacter stygius]